VGFKDGEKLGGSFHQIKVTPWGYLPYLNDLHFLLKSVWGLSSDEETTWVSFSQSSAQP